MIKLASIVKEILDEAKRGSGTYTYNFEFDDTHIPALVRPNESVEIELNINYNYYIGKPGTHEDPPESDVVEISDWDIEDIIIRSIGGEHREVDLRFIHPQAKKALYSIIEANLEKNGKDIESKIMNGVD